MALLIELIKKADDDIITAISIVESPAILTNFLKFSEDNKTLMFAIQSEEKKEIVGPVLIPNVKIYRSAESLGISEDAYVYFSADTIRELAYDFLGNARNNETTIEHETKSNDKFRMLEFWLIEDKEKDKAAALGLDLPIGTLMAKYKVLDDELWQDIKNGNLNGFSVEVQTTMMPIGELKFDIELNKDGRKILPQHLYKNTIDHLKLKGVKQSDLEKEGWEVLYKETDVTDIDSDTDSNFDITLLTLAITSDPLAKSKYDKGSIMERYYYNGPRDDKNRDFCRQVLDANLIYRREDISKLSNPDFGEYNIFEYAGSYGCRHKWSKIIFGKRK